MSSRIGFEILRGVFIVNYVLCRKFTTICDLCRSEDVTSEKRNNEMVYIVSLSLIWALSIVLLINNYHHKVNRWGCFTTFVVGLHYFANVINESLIPILNGNLIPMIYGLQPISIFFTSVSYLFYPYCLVMLSIHSSVVISQKIKHYVPFLLLIPILVIYIFVPPEDFLNPTIHSSYVFLTIWSTFGIFLADFLLIFSYVRTLSLVQKKETLLICIFIIPATLLGWTFNFLFPVLGIKSLWRYNIVVVITLLSIYGYLVTIYGFLGIKVRFERHNLSNAIKTMTMGNDMLMHALKNEIVKISLCSRNITALKDKSDLENLGEYIGENANNISISSGYLLKILKRIHDYMQDNNWVEYCTNLSEIIEDAINLVAVFIKEKNISIKRIYSYGKYGFYLNCDPIHLKEMFNNILRNAIEAVEVGGEIKIYIVKTKKQIIVEITDNGCGIPKQNIPYVITPYFSTKKNTLNYGLGLSYCYNVMQKHDGMMEIDSIEKVGTTVFLRFPIKRLVENAETLTLE